MSMPRWNEMLWSHESDGASWNLVKRLAFMVYGFRV